MPTSPVKAAPPPVELPWWTHGFVEVGDRGFLNDPTYGGHIVNGQGSLAKFYEYSNLKPGAFGDFNVAAGSKNGLYEIDVWGKNVGYSDQRYNAYLSKAGEQYFNFDVGPDPARLQHQRQTLFNTNGNALTLANPNIGSQMFKPGGAWVCRRSPTRRLPVAASQYQGGRRQHHHQPECASHRYRHYARYGVGGLSLYADRQLGHQGQLLQHAQDRKPGRQRAFHGHEHRLSCRCRQAGQRYHAELRRERRVHRHLRLGAEVQRDGRL